MIWLAAALVIGLIYIAELFRIKAVHYEQECNWWRNEAVKLSKQLESQGKDGRFTLN